MKQIDIIKAESAPVKIGAEVQNDGPEEVGVMKGPVGAGLVLEVEAIQQVHTAVWLLVVFDERQVQVSIGARVGPHRPDHIDILLEIRVVKAYDQAISHDTPPRMPLTPPLAR